jgi:hypothetical protein
VFLQKNTGAIAWWGDVAGSSSKLEPTIPPPILRWRQIQVQNRFPSQFPAIFSPKSHFSGSGSAVTMQNKSGSTGRRSSAALRSTTGRRPFVAPSAAAAARFPSAGGLHLGTGVQGSSPGGGNISSLGAAGVPSSAAFQGSTPVAGSSAATHPSDPRFPLGKGVHGSSPGGRPSPGFPLGAGSTAGFTSSMSPAPQPSSSFSDLFER